MGDLEPLIEAYKANSSLDEPDDYIDRIANQTLEAIAETNFHSSDVANLITRLGLSSSAKEGAAAYAVATIRIVEQAKRVNHESQAGFTIEDAISLVNTYKSASMTEESSATLSLATTGTFQVASQTKASISEVSKLIRALSKSYYHESAVSISDSVGVVLEASLEAGVNASDALSVVEELDRHSYTHTKDAAPGVHPDAYSGNLALATKDVLYAVKEHSLGAAVAVKFIEAYGNASTENENPINLSIATCRTLAYKAKKTKHVDHVVLEIEKLKGLIKAEEVSNVCWGFRWLYSLANCFGQYDGGAVRLSEELVSK